MWAEYLHKVVHSGLRVSEVVVLTLWGDDRKEPSTLLSTPFTPCRFTVQPLPNLITQTFICCLPRGQEMGLHLLFPLMCNCPGCTLEGSFFLPLNYWRLPGVRWVLMQWMVAVGPCGSLPCLVHVFRVVLRVGLRKFFHKVDYQYSPRSATCWMIYLLNNWLQVT